MLEAFLAHRHPVSLISKGSLMRRDLDLLSALAEHNLCSVAISVPTLDKELKRLLEPRVPAAAVRLRLIDDLHQAGVPVSLLMAPIIPALNDREIESVVANAAARGVSRARYIFLRLPREVSELFQQWLAVHMPQRAAHIMSLVRQASAGPPGKRRWRLRWPLRHPAVGPRPLRRNARAALCRSPQKIRHRPLTRTASS